MARQGKKCYQFQDGEACTKIHQNTHTHKKKLQGKARSATNFDMARKNTQKKNGKASQGTKGYQFQDGEACTKSHQKYTKKQNGKARQEGLPILRWPKSHQKYTKIEWLGKARQEVLPISIWQGMH